MFIIFGNEVKNEVKNEPCNSVQKKNQ